jgi:phosphoglycolate phosphatase
MLVKRLMPEKEAENEERVTEVLAHYNKSYGEIYMHTTEMYPGVGETVKLLARMGVKIAVYSNKQDAYVKDLVSMYFPNGEVSVARGQTDIPVKPDPAGVRLILGELGVTADESIFVGDSGVDLKTAENSGMDFIGVAWGFCGRDALAEMGAKVIIDEPSEIMNLVK